MYTSFSFLGGIARIEHQRISAFIWKAQASFQKYFHHVGPLVWLFWGSRPPWHDSSQITPPSPFPLVISIPWHCSASGLQRSGFLGLLFWLVRMSYSKHDLNHFLYISQVTGEYFTPSTSMKSHTICHNNALINVKLVTDTQKPTHFNHTFQTRLVKACRSDSILKTYHLTFNHSTIHQ